MNLRSICCYLAGLLGSFVTSHADPGEAWQWQQLLAPALHQNRHEEIVAQQELAALGEPVMGQTAPQFGFQLPRFAAPPVTAPWVQIDLRTSQPIDWITLIPAQLDWQSAVHKVFAFPKRFRVDISNDPTFAAFTSVAVLTDSDYPEPGLAPVSFRIDKIAARYVRITVTKLPEENAQYFFALAEIMVLAGNRNLAIGCPVSASAASDLPPRWALANLVDGRTPLGPPIRHHLLAYDGLFTGLHEENEHGWMQLDLGRRARWQEIRLHPVHARLGADVPGYAFPARFRIEASDDPEFSAPTLVFDATNADFPNPGNNPVTIPTTGIDARYLRIVFITPTRGLAIRRFGLSEIEIYADDINIARHATVTAAVDTTSRPVPRPPSLLVDGYTSYGQLLELPVWLETWQLRDALQIRLSRLSRERTTLLALAQHRAIWIGTSLLIIGAASLGLYLYSLRRKRERELERLRTRLAHDLHDEIGSNLAGLGVLSENATDHASPSEREDWIEVTRIARETTEVMREVLWLVGARQESGIDLDAHLRLAAKRMLPNQTVRWSVEPDLTLANLPIEIRRQVFLFFKESLTNIVRHARATVVEISLRNQTGWLELKIADNGVGFDSARVKRGVGLESLHERARTMAGNCRIDSVPDQGTTIILLVPSPSKASAPPSPSTP